MKLLKLSLTFLYIISLQLTYSQGAAYYLDFNNVRARINDRGSLFNNPNIGSAGYEIPNGSGNHLIFQAGFWFGGKNQDNDLKLAAHLYSNDYDYYAGPYSTSGDYDSPDYQAAYQNSLWVVKRFEINNHINDFEDPNYVMPNGILNWPGNGDPSIGVSEQLAPFIDVNNNGVYEPHLGDYPCIKGDIAVYQIMHEDSIHVNSGGNRIGAEIHMMVYQYVTSDFSNYINTTTFIETTIYNRGQNSFTDFKSSFFVDTDLGNPEDDYIGSLPSKNLMYSYNGTDNDQGYGGGPGYPANAPAIGVVSLDNEIEYSGTFYRVGSSNPMTTNPSTTVDYWNYMNGKWKDGSDWTYGGDAYGGTDGPTKHMYDGNPEAGTSWTEMNTDGNGAQNAAGDRRLLMTTKEASFLPGEKLTYNYAIIYNRSGNHLENVGGIIKYADSVQLFFDNGEASCPTGGSGTNSVDKEYFFEQFSIYPNPATSQVKVVWNEMNIQEIKITSFQGKLVKRVSANGLSGEKIIDIDGFSPGVYFVSVGNSVRKLIVN